MIAACRATTEICTQGVVTPIWEKHFSICQIPPRQHRHHDNPAVTANCTAPAFNSITSVGAGAQWKAAHIQNERLSFAEARSDVCASVCFCNWVRVSVCVRGWSAKGLFIFSGNHYLDKLALMIHRIAVGGY